MYQTDSKSKEWFFPPLFGGERQGLNLGSVDLFKKVDNLGRESAQNCINATNSSEATVKVTYKLETIDSKYFPGRDDYLYRLNSAKKYFENSGDGTWTSNEINRLAESIKMLESPTIKVLVISDYNTTGLYGSETHKMSPYFRFFKSTGFSAHQGSLAGTYGHGKNALINFSKLRAISVYSKHISHPENQSMQTRDLYVGRSNLCTHIKDDLETQGTGYFGITSSSKNDWQSFRGDQIKNVEIPFERNELGTDIYVWGFPESDEWDLKLSMGLSYAFFQAIKEQKIEFRIIENNQLKCYLSSETIEEQLAYLEHNCKARIGERDWKFNNASLIKGFLKCSGEGKNIKNITKEIKGLGLVNLDIYFDKNDATLKNKYCIMRKPLMTIQSFAKKCGTPYQAVCKVLSDEGNILLSQCEDPTHTEINAENVEVAREYDRKKYATAIRNLKMFINKEISELDPKIESFKEIPGANEYLPGDPLSSDAETFYDGTDIDQGNDQEQETFEMRLKKDIKVFDPKVPRPKNPNSRVVRRKPSSQGNTGGNTGNMGGQGTANGGKGHGAGTAGGNAKEDEHGKQNSNIPSEDLQIIRTRMDGNPKISKINIKALKNVEGNLRLGFTLTENGESFFPIKKFKVLNSSKSNSSVDEILFKDLKLDKDDDFYLEVEFPTSSNLTIGAY